MGRCAGFRWCAVALVLSVAAPAAVYAEVKLPSVFGDGMVLQRDMKVPVWGTAAAGEMVTVRVAEHTAKAKADAAGAWRVTIGPLATGGPYVLDVHAPSGNRTYRDVLVGDVWVCSGQSNMAFPTSASRNAASEIAGADYPKIRLFTVPMQFTSSPQKDCTGSWSICNPQTVPGFSAVGFFFGREIQRRLNVPVGLVQSAWGGTPAESWTSRKWLETDPVLTPMLSRIGSAKWDSWTPTGLFNGMIAPILPFGIKGVIWYQGESNADRAFQYRTLFPAMIRSWREAWGQGDLPFLWVQLANFKTRLPEPAESDWAELREAQTKALAVSKTGQAVTIDIGEADDIHPKDKQDVGLRLALAAMHVVYGEHSTVFSGPTYRSMSVRGNEVTLRFDNVGGGLTTTGNRPLVGFAVAGADHKFVWAQAKIVRDTVVVSSGKVAQPVAVRYGWASNPDCNLVNKEQLPASPFRTDLWPGVTDRKR